MGGVRIAIRRSKNRLIMNHKVSARVLLGLLLGSLALHVIFWIVSAVLLPDARWANEPVHALIEGVGAYVALTLVPLLLSQEKHGKGTSYNHQIAGALLSMGVLDGFHGALSVGNTFVWLHSVATLVGGLLFAAVWLPQRWFRRRWTVWIPLALSIAIGTGSIAFADRLPRMVVDGSFSPLAEFFNLTGGVALFVAAARLTLSYRATGNRDDLLFVIHCVLFGGAAIMFETSKLWDVAWWGWHVLRLLAYAVALLFMVVALRAQQRDLERLNQSLADEVTRRQESERDLVTAKQLAERANEAKSEFLANISHEIRTPMNAIVGINQLLLGTELEREQRHWLDISNKSSDTLLEILNNVLDFSKIEAGKIELEAIDMNVVACVRAVARRARRAGGTEGRDRAPRGGAGGARGRVWGSSAFAAGAAQPGQQRHQIHRARRSCRCPAAPYGT